ncbi:terminase family protein [Roseomonas sp. NAR14]|uniref:Terminase family protein n=1 Tax=Roseomonas acroporae TaxID=2937791 RepID=A0A9X1YDE3_9PROT|nr:terminase family protein [Roseomonas acroporae]MCK8788091.1 terminase family protein [Roseomonas acroporae]
MEFFAAGAQHRERLMLAANRIGKTEGIGGYETTLHLTGRYPHWWQGRRFDRPIRAWVAGKTNETTRDIVQTKLCGPVTGSGSTKAFAGTGLIPGDDLVEKPAWKAGLSDLADTVRVRHVSGGLSTLGIKSYQQGRGSFEGTEQDLIWLDEEPPMDVYAECLVRTMTTDGLVLLTFTPLEGMSEVVLSFLEDGKAP